MLIASVMPLLGSYIGWVYIVKGIGGVVTGEDFAGIVVVYLYTLQASGARTPMVSRMMPTVRPFFSTHGR